MPNAWPSSSMIASSQYLQIAIAKPFYYYIMVLATISPIQVLGLLQSLLQLRPSASPLFIILLLWPVSFLFGLTLVGLRGGGYQTRFLLPILPATSILAAIGIERFGSTPLSATLLSIGAFHALFYGVLFYPLFCDFEFHIFDIIECILRSPQSIPSSREKYSDILQFMKHFGLNRTAG